MVGQLKAIEKRVGHNKFPLVPITFYDRPDGMAVFDGKFPCVIKVAHAHAGMGKAKVPDMGKFLFFLLSNRLIVSFWFFHFFFQFLLIYGRWISRCAYYTCIESRLLHSRTIYQYKKNKTRKIYEKKK